MKEKNTVHQELTVGPGGEGGEGGGGRVHSGGPGSNVEVLLKEFDGKDGEEEGESEEDGGGGEVWIRGPGVVCQVGEKDEKR